MAAAALKIILLLLALLGCFARDPSSSRKLLPDREEHPERLIPSGPSDPKQYKNAINQAACRREFGIGAPPAAHRQIQREVPSGSEDPFQRLKDFVACWKSAVGGPHHDISKQAVAAPPPAAATSSSSSSKTVETIQPERQVPSGADPIHHKSLMP